MPEERRYTVPGRGIGKPDYTSKVSSGRVRPGLTLESGQNLKVFGIVFSDEVTPYPQVQPTLVAGGTDHLIDWSTGLDLPYTVPIGYTYTAVQIGHSMSQDFVMRIYMDTFFISHMGTKMGGVLDLQTDVVGLSTALLDPTANSAHIYDVIIENLGGANMEGSMSIWAILEAIGTPPLPGIKTVKCKFCGHEREVPQETIELVCENCGKLNIYYDLTKFRRTP